MPFAEVKKVRPPEMRVSRRSSIRERACWLPLACVGTKKKLPEHTVRGEPSVYKWGRQLSPGPESASTLTLELPGSREYMSAV